MIAVLWSSMLVRFIVMFIAWGIVITLFFVIMRLFEMYAALEREREIIHSYEDEMDAGEDALGYGDPVDNALKHKDTG